MKRALAAIFLTVFTYYMLGDAYAHKGDSAKSKDAFDKAMSMAHDAAEREEVQDAINSLGAEGKA